MDGMFNFMRARIFGDVISSIGYMVRLCVNFHMFSGTHASTQTLTCRTQAGGLFDGVMGASTAQDTSEWTRYQQQKDLKQQQDYLACIMESSISSLAYEGKDYMDQVCCFTRNAIMMSIRDDHRRA